MDDLLIQACRTGNLELLKKRMNMDHDNLAIQLASGYGHMDMVRYLVENGADIHVNDEQPLRWASANGHLEVVEYLVSLGSDISARNNYAFVHACEHGHFPVAFFLLENGVSIDNIHNKNDLAVRWASSRGHLAMVRFLSENGANIRADNDLAVRWASENGHLEVVKFLVEKCGADIHAENDWAVKRASENGHLDVVEYLVSLGSDITGNNKALRLAEKNRTRTHDRGSGMAFPVITPAWQIGKSDVNPFAGNPYGGSLVGPDHPMFMQDRNIKRPPSVPPHARFDPFDLFDSRRTDL